MLKQLLYSRFLVKAHELVMIGADELDDSEKLILSRN